jgi:hypothetical protein
MFFFAWYFLATWQVKKGRCKWFFGGEMGPSHDTMKVKKSKIIFQE